jgi:hypothetical protein
MSNTTPAFTGSGGYSTTQNFNTAKQYAQTAIIQHDITDSVQVVLDVRTFNNLIGIQKDVSNIQILTTGYFDNMESVFLTDSIAISAQSFVSQVNMSGTSGPINVLSVGKYSTFYQNFGNYIASYFGLPSPSNNQGLSQGVSTLYSHEYNFLPNNGIFDPKALLNILNGAGTSSDISGNHIDPLSGKIELTGITAALRTAVRTNVFNNRTASSLVSDGFFDGDVIYIAGGGTYGSFPTANGDGIVISLKITVNPIYSAQYSVNSNNTITRSLGTSLVIRLKNLSSCVISVTYDSNTSNSLTFTTTGAYSSFKVSRSLTNSNYIFIVSQKASTTPPNTDIFTDTNLNNGTLYYYSFTPVDSNGYTGVSQFITGKTLSQ